MSRMSRLAVAVAGAALLPALATVGLATSTPARAAVASTSSAPSAAPTPATTVVTFTDTDCKHCQVQLFSATWNRLHAGEDLWQSHEKTMTNGVVHFVVPTRLTRGLSASVTAPWEGYIGARTMVAFRYRGLETGDGQTVRYAEQHQRATGCFAGTTERRIAFDLTTYRERVPGTVVHHPIDANMTFATYAPATMAPLFRAPHGILAAQDVVICGHDVH